MEALPSTGTGSAGARKYCAFQNGLISRGSFDEKHDCMGKKYGQVAIFTLLLYRGKLLTQQKNSAGEGKPRGTEKMEHEKDSCNAAGHRNAGLPVCRLRQF
ncbi:MAG: hypothetical protein V8S89_06020 [Oscillospiraceae bacterium]